MEDFELCSLLDIILEKIEKKINCPYIKLLILGIHNNIIKNNVLK